jgi:hypothetical protein
MKNSILSTILATADYGKNIANWGFDQLFWVILLAGIAGAAAAAIKKSWVGAALTSVGTALICYFIKNPERLSDIGNTLAQTIGF